MKSVTYTKINHDFFASTVKMGHLFHVSKNEKKILKIQRLESLEPAKQSPL